MAKRSLLILVLLAGCDGATREPEPGPDVPREATVLVSGQQSVTALVVHGDSLYWTDAADGSVRRASKTGDEAVLVGYLSSPGDLAARQGRLYFTEVDG